MIRTAKIVRQPTPEFRCCATVPPVWCSHKKPLGLLILAASAMPQNSRTWERWIHRREREPGPNAGRVLIDCSGSFCQAELEMETARTVDGYHRAPP